MKLCDTPASGAAELLGTGLRVVERDALEAAIGPDTNLLLLTHVHYKTAERFDMAAWTRAAHDAGALAVWDLSHSVGAVPHALHDAGVDFAVWCSYKYLNAGPGAPGGLFVHERHFDRTPGLPGWWGHDKATQFEMAQTFRKAHGAGAYQVGTPSILALAGLEGALGVFEEVTIEAVRARSLSITMAQQGELLQPFCGALTSTSTPVAAMSTHMAPEAMQSSTNSPPTALESVAETRMRGRSAMR